MEINATITSRSGRVVTDVSRKQTGGRLRLVSHILGITPLTIRRDWFGPGGVTIEIRDPGEGK